MHKLNLETYNLLTQVTNDVKDTQRDTWYNLTYPLFKTAPLNSMDDLWRLVAFTYSWMPTIPKVDKGKIKDPESLLQNLKELKAGSEAKLEIILNELVPVINNSIVGTSKVLHFIAPGIIPIIDSRVVKGWNNFFTTIFTDHSVSKIATHKILGGKECIPSYMDYKQQLDAWVKNCDHNICLRDLDIAFWKLSNNLSYSIIGCPDLLVTG